MKNCLEILEVSQWVLHEKLPIGIGKFVNGCSMKNSLEVLENSSMGAEWKIA